MNITKTFIEGLIVIEPSIFTDYNTERTSKDNVTKFIEEMK